VAGDIRPAAGARLQGTCGDLDTTAAKSAWIVPDTPQTEPNRHGVAIRHETAGADVA